MIENEDVDLVKAMGDLEREDVERTTEEAMTCPR
jgi:hypothetical protein